MVTVDGRLRRIDSRFYRPAGERAGGSAAATEEAGALNAGDVLAAAQRCTWALADPGEGLGAQASQEILGVVLGAVRAGERAGYAERLESFARTHRGRLEEMLRAYGPGSEPAGHGRYLLVGRPESLLVCERMQVTPFRLRSRWDETLETVLLDDLEFAWGPRTRLSR